MSTLTKVLIVLLTISSIFLCGIVVTYVSNAHNYKKLHTDLKDDERAANENEKQAKKQLNLAIEEAGKQEQLLKKNINDLNNTVIVLPNPDNIIPLLSEIQPLSFQSYLTIRLFLYLTKYQL